MSRTPSNSIAVPSKPALDFKWAYKLECLNPSLIKFNEKIQESREELERKKKKSVSAPGFFGMSRSPRVSPAPTARELSPTIRLSSPPSPPLSESIQRKVAKLLHIKYLYCINQQYYLATQYCGNEGLIHTFQNTLEDQQLYRQLMKNLYQQNLIIAFESPLDQLKCRNYLDIVLQAVWFSYTYFNEKLIRDSLFFGLGYGVCLTFISLGQINLNDKQAVQKAFKYCLFATLLMTLSIALWEASDFLVPYLATLICAGTPAGPVLPFLYSLSVGLFQGGAAIVTQMLDEYYKYGLIKSSVKQLLCVGMAEFTSGFLSQLTDLLPGKWFIKKFVMHLQVTLWVRKMVSGVGLFIVNFAIDAIVKYSRDRLTEKKSIAKVNPHGLLTLTATSKAVTQSSAPTVQSVPAPSAAAC